MSKEKKDSSGSSKKGGFVNNKITAMIFIMLIFIIIISAVMLLFFGKSNEIVKGDSNIYKDIVTTASSDITTTAVYDNNNISYFNSSTSQTAIKTETVTETTTVTAIVTTAVFSQTQIMTASVKVNPNPNPQPPVTVKPPSNTSTQRPVTIVSGVSGNNDSNKVNSIELTFYTCELETGESVIPYVTMLPDTADLTEKWESSDESVAKVDGYGNITAVNSGECIIKVTSVNNPAVFAEVKVTVKGESAVTSASSENTSSETETTTTSSDEPTYIQGILIANKSYALPEDYNPGLDSDTEAAFNELSAAAAEEGLDIWFASGFRSYDTQNRIYNNYVDNYGQQSADRFSARPGHSEHQTGLAIDVNSIDDSFAGTPEAIWLEEHAHEYGFIIRYPKDKEEITGYKYEPWHIRYLGIEKATEVYKSGLTLEEFLGIDSVYND